MGYIILGAIAALLAVLLCFGHWPFAQRHSRVYRFSAMDLTAEERSSIHGNNERIRLDVIARSVAFYIRLMGKC